MRICIGFVLLASGLPACAQPAAEDAASIMAQVAANMASAAPARREFVYHQTVRSGLVQTNGKPVRRERREYDVLPGPEHSFKNLVAFEGEWFEGKKSGKYFQENEDENMDGVLVKDLTQDLVDDKKSRDGIPHSLFPLTSADLPNYQFTIQGHGELEGRPLIKIGFKPASKGHCVEAPGGDGDCTLWKGEIWVDEEERQPVRITTDLGEKVPLAVRVLLGTNVKQLGFSVRYQRLAPGVWFPVAYGTEFQLDVLFFYKRTITLGLESSDFRRTAATSTIEFEDTH